MNVAAWLDGIGLGLYADLFAENAIDDDVLGELTEEHLKELQVPLGHRLKLLKAIAKLHGVPRSVASAAEAHNGREPASEPSAGVPATEAASAAERRHLTVMFCDLVGSTALSAGLDPEDMRDLILAYQDTVASVVARFEGHVAKFAGDGVVAYFGWPRAHEDAAERAVRAARLIVEGVGEIQTPSLKPLAVRVGIATGLVVVGDLVGEGEAQERSVVGDTPNLAARLQGVAEPGEIVIAGSTRRLIGDIFSVEDLGVSVLKGIPQPMHAWKVLGKGDAEGRFEALHGKSLVPLIGREEEIDLLLRRWSLAKAGSGQVVMLTGEPGIGKSRLTQALLERLGSETKRDVRMFCSNYHANSALFPTIEHFERAARWQPGETPEVRLKKLETFIEASG
ncbi:AAA family ATPase, partial [Aurantimonas litoralis]|nr:AAA family ATPase [Aurantimonas litoralis]